MPVLGFGTYQLDAGRTAQAAVAHALRVGYRLIDTASLYGNEADCGAAIRDSGIAREEIFLVTKLWNSDHGYDRALRAFDTSLRRLGLTQVDLYLIHWPVAGLRNESWRALERIQREGRARFIGVSNYTERHLAELLARCEIPPAANQVEFHVFLQQTKLVRWCRSRNIAVMAYSPLAHGTRFRNADLQAIGRETQRSPAQVMIRWALQQGTAPLPRSCHPDRIRENAAVFDFALNDQQTRRLAALDEGLHTDWDPTSAP